jgi:hypothetical protein
MLIHMVSHLHERDRLWRHSLKIPHSSFTSSLSQVHMLTLVVAACGTKTGLPKWTVHLWKTLVFTWGKIFYKSCWNNRFLRVQIYIYIYIYIYDSEQTVVILTMKHVGWCDWPVTQNSRYWKTCNISCLNSHFLNQFMLKWNLYQHICLSAFVCYWCLLITSSYENLRTTWHWTTMLKCRDW